MLVELTDNGAADLLASQTCQPILQVLNFTTQPGSLTRVALSDGKKFLQTIAKVDLVRQRRIERLALVKVLEFTWAGHDGTKVVALKDIEVLKVVSYVVGSPSPLSQMSVIVEEEVRERNSVASTVCIGVYKCKGCGKELVGVRGVPPFSLLVSQLSQTFVLGPKTHLELDGDIQLVQPVNCACGLTVGMNILASSSDKYREKYQLTETAIDIMLLPDGSIQPMEIEPVTVKETIRVDQVMSNLQENVTQVTKDMAKRVNFLETAFNRLTNRLA